MLYFTHRSVIVLSFFICLGSSPQVFCKHYGKRVKSPRFEADICFHYKYNHWPAHVRKEALGALAKYEQEWMNTKHGKMPKVKDIVAKCKPYSKKNTQLYNSIEHEELCYYAQHGFWRTFCHGKTCLKRLHNLKKLVGQNYVIKSAAEIKKLCPNFGKVPCKHCAELKDEMCYYASYGRWKCKKPNAKQIKDFFYCGHHKLPHSEILHKCRAFEYGNPKAKKVYYPTAKDVTPKTKKPKTTTKKTKRPKKPTTASTTQSDSSSTSSPTTGFTLYSDPSVIVETTSSPIIYTDPTISEPPTPTSTTIFVPVDTTYYFTTLPNTTPMDSTIIIDFPVTPPPEPSPPSSPAPPDTPPFSSPAPPDTPPFSSPAPPDTPISSPAPPDTPPTTIWTTMWEDFFSTTPPDPLPPVPPSSSSEAPPPTWTTPQTTPPVIFIDTVLITNSPAPTPAVIETTLSTIPEVSFTEIHIPPSPTTTAPPTFAD